jgi:putative ABC transport system permease protein
MIGASYLVGFRRDVGFALRTLRRAPGFAAVAVATLALGIGTSTTLFTVVNSVLLRPLRFAHPQRLVMLRPTSGSRLSAGYLREWREQSHTLADIAGWYDARASLTGQAEPVELRTDRVTANFFTVLGTRPLIGRTFVSAGDLSHVPPAVVLSYGLWQRRFGGDPRVVGRSMTLDGESLTIVGVMPDSFRIRTNELSESRAELWLPFALRQDPRADVAGMGGFLNVVARLASGADVEQAQAELSIIAQRIEAAHPSYSRNWRIEVLPLLEATVKDIRPTLLVLLGAVAILLAIACANLATLLLSRAAGREAELALRVSLGATTGRLMRQLLTESVVLASAGGALGGLLAVWATRAAVHVLPPALDIPRTAEIAADLRVLAFAVFVTAATTILCGLLPSVAAARGARQSTMRAPLRSASSDRHHSRVSGVLVIAEVALDCCSSGAAWPSAWWGHSGLVGCWPAFFLGSRPMIRRRLPASASSLRRWGSSRHTSPLAARCTSIRPSR